MNSASKLERRVLKVRQMKKWWSTDRTLPGVRIAMVTNQCVDLGVVLLDIVYSQGE